MVPTHAVCAWFVGVCKRQAVVSADDAPSHRADKRSSSVHPVTASSPRFHNPAQAAWQLRFRGVQILNWTV
jgi:hypothetical protein